MRTRDIAIVGIFSALAFGLMFLEVPLLPFVNFLKYDPSEIPALILAVNSGIAQGITVILIKDILFYFAKSGDVIGIIMNFIAGAMFIILASKLWKNKLLSSVVSVGGTSVLMTALNAATVPLYFIVMKWGSASDGFKFFLKVWWGILVFNILKFSIDYVLTALINKRVRGLFKGE